MTTPDKPDACPLTPDKPDACPFCGGGFKNHFGNFKAPEIRWECDSSTMGERTPLCRALERANKAEAELAEVKMKLEVNEVLAVGLQRMLAKSETQNAKLRGLLEGADGLLKEVYDSHRNTDSNDYNACEVDNDQCQFCVDTVKVRDEFKKLKEGR